MSRTAIEKRVAELEYRARAGYVELPDGTRFKPARCFKLMRTALRIERDCQKEPVPSDFTAEEWDLWKKFAILSDPGQYSPLVEMTCQIAKKFIK